MRVQIQRALRARLKIPLLRLGYLSPYQLYKKYAPRMTRGKREILREQRERILQAAFSRSYLEFPDFLSHRRDASMRKTPIKSSSGNVPREALWWRIVRARSGDRSIPEKAATLRRSQISGDAETDYVATISGIRGVTAGGAEGGGIGHEPRCAAHDPGAAA